MKELHYHELQRIDYSLARQILETSNENKVPVSNNMKPEVLIHGAMDNFGPVSHYLSGKNSSQDIIRMVFLNNPNNV